MLKGRSMIVFIIVVMAVSLVFATLSLLQPIDHAGLAADTFGTRAHGYRGIFDTLAELGIDVKRSTIPPSGDLERTATVVLWGPRDSLVDIEPAYVRRLGQWVRQGGQVVVAPESERLRSFEEILTSSKRIGGKKKTAVEELGLPPIPVRSVDLSAAATSPTAAKRAPRIRWDRKEWTHAEVSRQMQDVLNAELSPTQRVAIAADGELASVVAGASTVEVPEQLQALDLGETEPSGRITLPYGKNEVAVVAACYPLGEGKVIVVGDVDLFENRLIAHADNAVVASRLLTDGRRSVLWDEFYHGLTIRGQPLYLLTNGAYAVFVLLALAATATWVWRGAVFLGPSLESAPTMRRTLSEYVDAMARFLDRGASSHTFLLREVRAGVLDSIRRKLNLRPGNESPARLAANLARRDPAAAQQLLAAAAAIDDVLSQRARPSSRRTLEALKGIDACL